MNRWAVFVIGLVVLGIPEGSFALEKWGVGEEGHSWGSVGTLTNLEEKGGGWIQPIEITGQNLSLEVHKRGGWVRGSHFTEPALNAGLNGDPKDGWGCTKFLAAIWNRGKVQFEDIHGERHDTDQFQDVTVMVDLGAPFGVDSLSFYTRAGFEDRLMEGYQIFVNEGSQVFTPPPPLRDLGRWKDTFRKELWYSWYPFVRDWKLLAEEKEVAEGVSRVDMSFPLETVRYIAINDYISLPDSVGWEIDEFEVWGKGFAMSGVYVSDVIDLGQMSNLGHIKWSASIEPETSVIIYTRTGRTPEPYLYYEKTGLGLTGETEVTQKKYNSLPVSKRGTTKFDTENWSSWSTPYPSTGDEPIVAPDPRRAFQFKIAFQSHSPLEKSQIHALAVEYSESPMAREIIGEMAPQEVAPGKVTTFRYVLLGIFDPGSTGFDALQISTPMEVDPNTIKDLRIDGLPAAFSTEVDAHSFTLRFPEHRVQAKGTADSVRIAFTFDCKVLTYGTRFSGKVFDTRTEEVPQHIVPGDAASDLETNDLIVTWALGGNLITNVDVSPKTLTPNDDGTNDVAWISYSLLQLSEPVLVWVSIYDLSGALVFELGEHQKNGVYAVSWDGGDDRGERVPAGIYIYRIFADTESGLYSRVGTIAVVY
jgi:hypothetical protein